MRPEERMYQMILAFAMICFVSTQADSNYQLPKDLIPLDYKLNIKTNLESSKYSGDVWITVECTKETSFIKLHSKGLVIYVKGNKKVSVSEKDKQSKIDISGTEHEEENDKFVINLLKPLKKDKIYVVLLSFEGDLDMTGEGFFRASYEDRAGSTRWYALTEFKTGARNTFPCFDEPHFRATFSINIGVQQPFTPISNTLVTNNNYYSRSKSQLSQTPKTQCLQSFLCFLSKYVKATAGSFGFFRQKSTHEDTVWYSFQETPPLSPHQVSLVITSLDHREVTFPWASASLHLWAQTEAIDRLEAAVSNPGKIASVILRFVVFYKDFFSIDFPLPKIDVVSLPDSGYITGLGVIIEKEDVLLSNVEMRETNRLAHEVAKLWLDGLVTFSWWSHLWYSWSLAEHLSTLAMHQVYPNWNIIDRVLVSQTENIYNEDSIEAPTVFMPISMPEEVIGSYYNNIFYDKGPVLIRMVHLFLGDKVFKEGLNAFLLKYQHRSATTDDLWMSLTEVAHVEKVLAVGLELQPIMSNWMTQTGFPVVSVVRDYQTGSVTVSQKRFIKDHSEEEELLNDCWWIPLTYTTSRKPTFSDTKPEYWLNCEDKELTFSTGATDSEWVLFNNKMAGLYRVNYDTKNWNLIADALKKPDFFKIDVLNRVQLLTDSWDFAKRGILEYKTAFSIFSYLQLEKEYLPWKVALTRIKVMKENFYRTPKCDVFKNFVKKLLTEVFKKFEDFEKAQDEEGKLEKRFIVKWACEFNVVQCNEKAKQLFLEWKNSHKPLPKDIRRMVLCKGVQGGEWEYLQNYYKETDDSDERKHILFALSCTYDSDLLKRYLEWSISKDSPIPSQFCFDAFRKVVKNEVGYNIAWDFFFNNIRRISDHSGRGDGVLTLYVTALAEQVVSDNELQKIKEAVENNEDLSQNVKDELEDTFNDAEERLNWLAKNYSPIIKAIEQINF